MIYLDYNATTPTDPRVVDKMLPFFSTHFGNPSSAGHAFGWAAEAAVEEATERVADLLGADKEEIVFTSGATEALNQAIKGVARSSKGKHIVTVQTEHSAVLDSCRALQRRGFEVTYLPVDQSGLVDPRQLADALRADTCLVAVMWANNEIGTIADIESLSRLARARGIPFLTDATQAVGKIPVSVQHVDLLACSAHKFYGPKGVGALYIRSGRRGVRLPRLIDGGGQQNDRRGGTLNVPGIVGMGEAARVAKEQLDSDATRLRALRDEMEAELCRRCDGAFVNAKDASRLPQTSNMAFPLARSSNLVAELRTIAVSSGSACHSEQDGPSHVIKAIGLSDEDARRVLRISLGRPTTEQDVRTAIEAIVEATQAASHPASHPVA